MSGRSRRDKSVYNLDYSVLHRDGTRIQKSKAMDPKNLEISEKQLRGDINENLNLYALQDLDTPDDVLEGLNIITDISKKFRHLHVELEEALDGQYQAQYGEKFTKTMEKVRDYQSEAKAKAKRLRQEESERSMERVLAEKREQELQSARKTLKVEVEVYFSKIRDEIDNFDRANFDDIKHSCQRFESLLDECYSLKSKAKVAFPHFERDYGVIFDDAISRIRQQIKTGNDLIRDWVLDEKRNLAREKAYDDERSKKTFLREQTSLANILINEVELRSKSLSSKCQCTLLANLKYIQKV